ncbi:MAG TPA: site-specific integrase, partial [Anaerolineales bacterium]|nr:site-specific integrase [Anaerolineales bacterium]
MILGFMSNVHLSSAKVTFLLDCQAANLTSKTLRSYRKVLTKFIKFTGDITVQALKPNHVRTYIAVLADGAGRRSLAKHYAVIRTWI